MNIIKRFKENEVVWERLEENIIANFPWDKTGYRPETKFKLVLTEKGLRIKFIGTENQVVIDKTDSNSRVYQDSCVEFFFNPDSKNSDNYINLEINARGTVLGQIGPNGSERSFLTEEDIEMLEVRADVNEINLSDFDNFKPWNIEYIVPFGLISKYYPNFSKENFNLIKCNFYKCGDKTKEAHYGSYFEIVYHKPSFHRPEFFGEFLIK